MKAGFLGKSFLSMVLAVILLTPASATVFYSKDEALQLAFGNDAAVEVMTMFPSQFQLEQIEKLAKTKLDSKMLSFYVGKKQGAIVGYAAIDSHPVRTQSETLLIVLDANGNLRETHTLAFHEPPEYQAPARWFMQLVNHGLESLSFDQDVQAVAGATLSTRAALGSARKTLSIYQVMIKSSTS